MTTIDTIQDFCNYYIEQCGAVFFTADDLANAVIDATGDVSDEEFAALVARCADVIAAKAN